MNETAAQRPVSTMYLCAPVNALVEGIYQENISFTDLLQHGDFGLGTFDSLDGEMVLLDGRTYRITGEGRVSEIDAEEASTPFACVIFYQAHSEDDLDHPLTHTEFDDWLMRLLPSPNMMYAIRLEGTFSHIRVRSVPKQASYRPLVQVAADQPEFEFADISGTLAGFFTPTYMAKLNVPGLHLHFLSDDRQHGGHLLTCAPQMLHAGIQFVSKLELSLPMTLDYLTLDFQRDTEKDLDKAEK